MHLPELTISRIHIHLKHVTFYMCACGQFLCKIFYLEYKMTEMMLKILDKVCMIIHVYITYTEKQGIMVGVDLMCKCWERVKVII